MSTSRQRSDRRPSGAVPSALEILGRVASSGPGLTARELSADLALPPASTYRLLNLLVSEEFLVRLPDGHGFALGGRAARLLAPLAVPFVPAAARHEVEQLRAGLRCGVHLVLYATATLRVVDADPDRPLSAPRALARHLHASAAGKLLLAEGEGAPLPPPTEPLRRLTPRTLVDRARLTDCLARVREDQVACSTGELSEDVACVAVPVRDGRGRLAAGLLLSGPLERAPALREHLDVARGHARALAPLLS